MVSNSAKLDCMTMQHTESGVSTSDGSRDMARTRSCRKKKKKKEKKEKRKKMNSWNPIKHRLRGSLIIITRNTRRAQTSTKVYNIFIILVNQRQQYENSEKTES